MTKSMKSVGAVIAIIAGFVLVFAMLLSPAKASTGSAADPTCTPSAAYTSYYVVGTSDSNNASDASWVTADQAPAAPYYKIATRTVVDQEAYDETIVDQEAIPSQHYSEAHNEGDNPLGNDEVPPTPAEDPSVWQADTTQEPPGHYGHMYKPDGTLYAEGDSGLHYASHGSSGRRDWFYFQAAVAEVTHIVHHPAVTHDEFQYAQDHSAVECPTPTPTDTPTPTLPPATHTSEPNPPVKHNNFVNHGTPKTPVRTALPNAGL